MMAEEDEEEADPFITHTQPRRADFWGAVSWLPTRRARANVQHCHFLLFRRWAVMRGQKVSNFTVLQSQVDTSEN
jgi:hypothetical protein